MAELTLTTAFQYLTTTGSITYKTAGEAIAKFDALFIVTDSGTGTVGTVKKAVNTTEEQATFYGFAVEASESGKQVGVLRTGYVDQYTGSSEFVAGNIYVVSSTAGKLELPTDLATTEHMCVVCACYQNGKVLITPSYVGQLP
jgi:hypothetical protein